MATAVLVIYSTWGGREGGGEGEKGHKKTEDEDEQVNKNKQQEEEKLDYVKDEEVS
jgi:hypothetical protein